MLPHRADWTRDMPDELTNDQIALLCQIGEMLPPKLTNDRKRDLEQLVGADRLAISLRPAQAHEHILRASLGHPHDFAWAERTGSRGQEEVLSHIRAA
jgi:hypothetical protein